MWEHFEHTADLGLRATAPDRNHLFAEMAVSLTAAIIEDPATIRPEVQHSLELQGVDREYLLFDWLRELLVRFETERMLYCRFEIEMRVDGLSATVYGERYDPSRHLPSHEVKAVTYHGLKVEPTDWGWLAEAIVDI